MPGSVIVPACQYMQLQRLSLTSALQSLSRFCIGPLGIRLPMLCVFLGYGGSIRDVSWSCTAFIHSGSASLVFDGPVVCVFDYHVICIPGSG